MAQYTERLWTQTKDTEQLTFIAGVDLPYRELVKESGPNTNIMVVATAVDAIGYVLSPKGAIAGEKVDIQMLSGGPGGGGGSGVQSVTGLDTDNTDPLNPIVNIAVDGVTIIGDGTPGNPLESVGGGGGGSDVTAFTLLGQTLTITTNQPGSFPVNLGLVLPSLTDLTGGQYLFDNTNGNPDVFFQIPPSQFQNLGNIGRLDYAAIGGGVIDANTTTWNNANVTVVESPPGTFTFDNGVTPQISWNSSTVLNVLTYGALQTLISTSAIDIGAFYWITDATAGSSYIIPGLVGVIVQGTQVDKVSLQGSGGFYVPDYAGTADWSGVGTPKGVWRAANEGTYFTNDAVIWNGITWTVIDAAKVNGTSPDLNADAYTPAAFAVTNGYLLEWDHIEYDNINDYVLSRNDKRGNSLRADYEFAVFYGVAPLVYFQWGNANVLWNTVTNSLVDCLNQNSEVKNNLFLNGGGLTANTSNGRIQWCTVENSSSLNAANLVGDLSQLTVRNVSYADVSAYTGSLAVVFMHFGQLNIANAACNFDGCTIMNSAGTGVSMANATSAGDITRCNFYDCQVDADTNDAPISYCDFTMGCTMDVTRNAGQTLRYSRVSGPYTYSLNPAVSYINCVMEENNNTFPETLDITGALLIDLTGIQYAGIINLTSTNGTETVSTLTNSVSSWPIKLIPENGLSVDVIASPVAGAVITEFILENDTTVTLVGRSSVSDFLVLRNENSGYIRQITGSII